MKKVLSVLLVIAFLLTGVPSSGVSFVRAEDELPYYCEVDTYDMQKCSEYLQSLNRNITDIKNQIEEAESDLATAQALAMKYAGQLDGIETEIADLNTEVAELDVKIEELKKSIEENEVKVEDLNTRVLKRMEEAQKTMHFNPYLDFILSATGFDDMLRRVYGIEAITGKDKKDREDLKEMIEKLKADKEELDLRLIELDEKKNELLDKQAQLIIMRNYWLEVQRETEAQIEEMQNALEEARQSYSYVLDNLPDISGVPSSEGKTSPVPRASISPSVWYYTKSLGGGVHLGVDYAVGMGQIISAPMNGIVIRSSDNCDSYGYLGNGCPLNGPGVAAGGNQVTMIGTAIDSNGDSQVYGVSFFHMQSGSPTGTGVIMQGDYVGRVGSSGNSTGPHCHIELYYLGPGDMTDIRDDYLNRSYSSSFNCGWGSFGLYRLCENGTGAPCRLNPTLYFGK